MTHHPFLFWLLFALCDCGAAIVLLTLRDLRRMAGRVPGLMAPHELPCLPPRPPSRLPPVDIERMIRETHALSRAGGMPVGFGTREEHPRGTLTWTPSKK